jgi:hypothetical protein
VSVYYALTLATITSSLEFYSISLVFSTFSKHFLVLKHELMDIISILSIWYVTKACLEEVL